MYSLHDVRLLFLLTPPLIANDCVDRTMKFHNDCMLTVSMFANGITGQTSATYITADVYLDNFSDLEYQYAILSF